MTYGFLGPLEPGYDPICYSRRHMNDYFIFATLYCVCNNRKFDFMQKLYGCDVQNMFKMAHFR